MRLATADVAVEDEVLGRFDELEAFELGASSVVAVESLVVGEAGLAQQARLPGSGALFDLEAEPCLDSAADIL